MQQKSLKKNFIMNLVLTCSTFIFPLITFPYVTRILLPTGVGTVSLVQSFISYFSLAALLGIPIYGIRACAKVRDDKEKLSATVQELLIMSLCLTVIAYVGLYSCVFFIPQFASEKVLVVIVSSSIFLTTIGISWLYSAVEEYSYITIRSIAFNLLSLVAIFVFVRDQSDYIIYAAILVISAGGANILNLIHARKFIYFKKKTKYNFKQHLKPMLIFFGMVAAVTIYTNLDKVMLGFIVNDANFSVGIYEAGLKIYRVLISLANAMAAVLLPRLAYYITNKREEEFSALLAKSLNYILIFTLPMIIFFIIRADDIVMLLVGENFVNSISIVRILMPAVVFSSLTIFMGNQIMTPLGKEKKQLISVACGAAVDLVLNFILIPIFVKQGNAAIATAISTFMAELTVLIIQICFNFKYLKTICKKIRIVNILIMFVVVGLVSFTTNFINISLIIDLVISVLICAVAYVGTLVLIKDPLMKSILSVFKNKKNQEQENINEGDK